MSMYTDNSERSDHRLHSFMDHSLLSIIEQKGASQNVSNDTELPYRTDDTGGLRVL